MKKFVIIATLLFPLLVTSAPDMPDGGWYYASCKTHDWMGHARDNPGDAAKDNIAHKKTHPDEQHEVTILRNKR